MSTNAPDSLSKWLSLTAVIKNTYKLEKIEHKRAHQSTIIFLNSHEVTAPLAMIPDAMERKTSNRAVLTLSNIILTGIAANKTGSSMPQYMQTTADIINATTKANKAFAAVIIKMAQAFDEMLKDCKELPIDAPLKETVNKKYRQLEALV